MKCNSPSCPPGVAVEFAALFNLQHISSCCPSSPQSEREVCPPWCHCRFDRGWTSRKIKRRCLATHQTRSSASSRFSSSASSGWRTRSLARGSPWSRPNRPAASPSSGLVFWSPRACGGFTWVPLCSSQQLKAANQQNKKFKKTPTLTNN